MKYIFILYLIIFCFYLRIYSVTIVLTPIFGKCNKVKLL